MSETIQVLVVDDEDHVRKALKHSFKASRRYQFDVTCVESPEKSPEAAFDVCIIDLGFNSENREFVGFKMLLGLACVRSQGIAIVYSGHPSVQNVVRAMKLGATDFVSKADCVPHKLVERVEAMLVDRHVQDKQRKQINEFLRDQNKELCQQYAGRVLAIVVEEDKPKVVTDGVSRLDALLNYSELRSNHADGDWPVDPHLHILPPAAVLTGTVDG